MRKVLTTLLLLLGCALSRAQGLEEFIRLAQDSTITAFQSQYEYESGQARYARFEALRNRRPFRQKEL